MKECQLLLCNVVGQMDPLNEVHFICIIAPSRIRFIASLLIRFPAHRFRRPKRAVLLIVLNYFNLLVPSENGENNTDRIAIIKYICYHNIELVKRKRYSSYRYHKIHLLSEYRDREAITSLKYHYHNILLLLEYRARKAISQIRVLTSVIISLALR